MTRDEELKLWADRCNELMEIAEQWKDLYSEMIVQYAELKKEHDQFAVESFTTTAALLRTLGGKVRIPYCFLVAVSNKDQIEVSNDDITNELVLRLRRTDRN